MKNVNEEIQTAIRREVMELGSTESYNIPFSGIRSMDRRIGFPWRFRVYFLLREADGRAIGNVRSSILVDHIQRQMRRP